MSQIVKLVVYGWLVVGCGCTTVATKTIEATGTVVKTTLQVGADVTKKVVGATIEVAGATFSQGVVTVIDSSSGVSRKVPWKEGLSASAASKLSAIDTAGKAIEIVRGAQRIQATTETVLKPDDMVRIK